MPILASSSRAISPAFALVEEAERTDLPDRLHAEHEVPRDAHLRQDREVLVDGGDAAGEGVARRGEDDRLAVDEHGALVGPLEAGEDLDQRRLAGAVVAEQADHLAGTDADRHVGERHHRAEELRDGAGFDDRASSWPPPSLNPSARCGACTG